MKLTFAGDKNARPPSYPDIQKVAIKTGVPEKEADVILTGPVGWVGSGGNSGFQAMNLAVQFGATGILGIGFDMCGDHWYGRNGWDKANNPGEENFKRWRKAFESAAPVLSWLGVEFINASMNSTLNCFPKMSVEDALRRWGL